VFGQQAQVVEQNLLIADAIGRGVAAHQHQVGAQFLHQVEFALGPLQVARQAVAAAAFEVAKRLEQGDGNAQVGAHLPDFPGLPS
jgi:predicted LPLAT superfamily acyltransferase